MKNQFSWRIQPSEDYFKQLWNEAIFVFDTNILLDFYRVSRSTSDDYFRVFEKIEDRLWLPYQVAHEFFERREGVIDSEISSFQKAISELEKWKDEQKKFTRLSGLIGQAGRIVHAELTPLLDQQHEYYETIDKITEALKLKIEELSTGYSTEHILERFLNMFDSRVSTPYDKETLQKLFKEGELRYKNEMPPGFKDDKDGDRKYGDLILWKQVLEYAKESAKPVIFVTKDSKSDWWVRKDGQVESPHPLLRQEFKNEVGLSFWMYSLKKFLEWAKRELNVDITQETLQETRDYLFIDHKIVEKYPEESLDKIEQLGMKNYSNYKFADDISMKLDRMRNHSSNNPDETHTKLSDYLNFLFYGKSASDVEGRTLTLDEHIQEATERGEKLSKFWDIVNDILNVRQQRE